MTAQVQETVHKESTRSIWRGVLTALIILLCLPSSSLAILWFVRLFVKDQSFGHFTFALFFAPYLLSAAFGPYILALAFVLWLFQIRMGRGGTSKAISAIFLILALIGMLVRNSAMS
jgi:hypothetical protein